MCSCSVIVCFSCFINSQKVKQEGTQASPCQHMCVFVFKLSCWSGTLSHKNLGCLQRPTDEHIYHIHKHTHMHTNMCKHAHNCTPSHTHTYTPTHTRTHAIKIHALLVIGWWKIEVMTDQYAEEVGFQFWLKMRECGGMLDTVTDRGREFQMTGPTYWKYLSPMVLLPILRTPKIQVPEGERREQEGE